MALYSGFIQLGAGLSVGLAGLSAGFAIGIVGDAGVRGVAQQVRARAIKVVYSLACADSTPCLSSPVSLLAVRTVEMTAPGVLGGSSITLTVQ